MRKKLLIIFGLLCFALSGAYAQTKVITGIVTGADDKLPLPGASVRIKGSTIATQTSVEGEYRITVPSNSSVLVFTFIGYVVKEISVGTQTRINAALTSDAKALSEVVVTGYGTQTKKEVSGAISTISGSSFENQPIASIDKALQGRAAGVVVQASNGIPGGSVNVQIRGIGSVNASTTPLYIVDGVQLNTTERSDFTQTNPLATINSNDIESIQIIKDAATAAVYGSQAANGVVIITTKQGKSGPTKFNVNGYSGVSTFIKDFDVLNTQEYFALRLEAFNNARSTTGRASIISEMGLPAAITDAEIAALPTYDWQNEMYRTGKFNNYELSASGGADKTRFYISGAYNHQETFISKADFTRGTMKINLNHQATSKLSFDTKLNLSTINQSLPFAESGSFLGSAAFAASTILPSNKIRNDDGTYYGLLGSGQVFGGVLSHNIAAVTDYNDGYQSLNSMLGTMSASYKLFSFLSFKSSFSLDYQITNGKSYRDPRTNDGYAVQGRGSTQSQWITNFQTTQLLSFNKSFNNIHKIDGQVGYEYRSDLNEATSGQATGFPSPQFQNLNSAATVVSVGESWTGYKRASVLGTVNYSFKGKYNLKGAVSYNGSSRFGDDYKYGWFPGISANWVISDESFLASTGSWLSSLKLRASWGQNGRDGIGNFDARALYSGGGVYNNSPGIAPSGFANPALKWEVREMIDFGIDFGFFQNRLSGSVGGFIEDNKDLLFSQPLQTSTGFSSITTNVGALQQKGLEVELNSINLSFKDFEWSSNFNFTYIKNSLTKLYGGYEILPGDPSLRIGWDITSIFTQRYAGVNPATGRPMWLTINNDLTYAPTNADRVLVGTSRPKYTGGFTNSFKYKGLDLEFLLQYQYGRKIADGQWGFLVENGTRAINTLQSYYDRRWTTPGQVTDVPRPYNGGAETTGSNHLTGSTRTQLNTDYIKLRTIQLGFAVPKKLMSKAKIGSARIYAQGTNLFTYADYEGYDPEFTGAATGIIPQSKNLTFGLMVGF